jgi:hypothetical protein
VVGVKSTGSQKVKGSSPLASIFFAAGKKIEQASIGVGEQVKESGRGTSRWSNTGPLLACGLLLS